MTDAWGGPRNQVRPPDKGVFPLDHFHECQGRKREYMECLRRNNGSAKDCADISMKYLECRMETELMERQDLGRLGFRASPPGAPGGGAPPPDARPPDAGGTGGAGAGAGGEEDRRGGFVAGLKRVQVLRQTKDRSGVR